MMLRIRHLQEPCGDLQEGRGVALESRAAMTPCCLVPTGPASAVQARVARVSASQVPQMPPPVGSQGPVPTWLPDNPDCST